MRTIQEAYRWLKERDPETALTQSALRRLVTTGELPSTSIGSKYLINLDLLEAFLAGELNEQPEMIQEHSKIRRVDV